MARQSPTTYARTSISVVALYAIVWSCPVFGDEDVPLDQSLSKGGPYEVFLSQKPRKEHLGALLAVVQTRSDPNTARSLVFLQTKEGDHIGKGIVCEHADERQDSAFECHHHIGGVKETLTIGPIDSKFCDDLRENIEDRVTELGEPKDKLYTKDKTNPIATAEECTETHKKSRCVCYDIKHEPPDPRNIPPNSGSGTGGHN